eukprot:TRINITY_DN8383_c0_g1_i1.p1 TRINITY_DN8383_c0_g1~~TRINITY_DN8383_c0_g1_i1.p1  ORF type:complete len:162 (+),score=63.71 TRINITY_DN8383_c0_g1_i1:289-774(+)
MANKEDMVAVLKEMVEEEALKHGLGEAEKEEMLRFLLDHSDEILPEFAAAAKAIETEQEEARAARLLSEGTPALREFSREEVARHNTAEECWMVVEDRVYDVASFVDEHPGGRRVMERTAGSDVTNAFLSIGHSKRARDLLRGMCIGKIEGTNPEIRLGHM